MHILIVQPTSDKKGHYGIWTVRMAQELANCRCRVTLFTNKVQPEKYLSDKPKFSVIEHKAGKYAFEKFENSSSSLVYYWGYYRNSYVITSAALKYALSHNVDAVFITDSEFLTASLLLMRYRRKLPPVVMHVNAANFSFNAYAGSILNKTYKVFQREIFKKVLGNPIKTLVVLTPWHIGRLRKQLALADDFPIEVIPDAAEPQAEMMDKQQARNKLGIDYQGTVLLAFGILRKDKDIENLLRAVATLKDKDFQLILAGAPMEYSREQIEQTVENLGITDKVILRLGYVPEEDVCAYFSASDALVLAYKSIYSGGSGPLMKGACTYRRPLIATDVSAMGSIVKEHKIGIAVKPDSPNALAEGIKKFLDTTPEEKKQMVENSVKLAELNSWQKLGQRYAKLYEKIVK